MHSFTGVEHTQHPLQPSQEWMRAYALAHTTILEQALRQLPTLPQYTYLRGPETGMIMLEGKAGSTGQRFNLGEMLVTRCAVALHTKQDGKAKYEGHAYIMGNNQRHAAMAAVLDALMQDADFAENTGRKLVSAIVDAHSQKQKVKATKTATTKVDFFTMVRGEDA